MKKNSRISRYYDLTKDFGEYKSSNSLIGWWTFNNKDSPSAQQIPSKGTTSLPGKFIDGWDDQVVLGPSSFESPTFLKGLQHLNKASATISNGIKGFQVDGFADQSSYPTKTFTLSITFRILQDYPQPIGAGAGDKKINIATICDTNPDTQDGRLGLYFDSDGAPGGLPSFSTALAIDDGTVKIWQSYFDPTHPRFSSIKHLREWIRIDFVVNDIIRAESKGWLGSQYAEIYINGLPPETKQSINTAAVSSFDITKLLIGGVEDNFAPLAGKPGIQLGEVAIFSAALTSNEISYLYDKTQSSENSGKLTNSPRSQLTCGECEHDSYPTINRSTDWRRTGRRIPVFSEDEGFTVPTQTGVINYPTLLLSGTEADAAIGTILTNNNSLPTIETVIDTPSGSIGRSNIVKSYKKCSSTTDSSDIYRPFNDLIAPTNIATQNSHMAHSYPGFTNTLGDRVIIDIDITPTSAKVLRVVTGSDGETFDGPNTLSSIENTGLAYFNFVNGNFESIGGINSETGVRSNWNLPGARSGSACIGNKAAYDAGPLYQKFNSLTDEDWLKIPRIFQPYSSIISHRGTFNHPHTTDFNSFQFFKGKSSAVLDIDTSAPLSAPTATQPLFPDPDSWFESTVGYPNSPGYGGYNRVNNEWSPYNSDVSGRGWWFFKFKNDPKKYPDPQMKTPSLIWNRSTAPVDLGLKFLSTLSTLGKPIVYTNWCNNSLFHASSSQTLKMSDYINSPLLLESFEVNVDVEAKRLQRPFLKEIGSGKFAMASNTNNHIDCLTFFLLRQENPHVNSFTPLIRSQGSKRELVSYSNHIFASTYVGYDWLDRSRIAVDWNTGDQTTVPYCGSRTSRVFAVREDEVLDTVAASDSFSYYKKSDGTSQTSHGPNGIFFSKFNDYTILGHPDPDIPLDTRDIKASKQPFEQYVTASKTISTIAPVRITEAYAQKITPVLPSMQSTVPQRVGVSNVQGPFFNFHTMGSTIDYFFRKTSTPIQPRLFLDCMGTYWPGGTTTKNRKRFDSDLLSIYAYTSPAYQWPFEKIEDRFSHPYSRILTYKTGSVNTLTFEPAADIISKMYTPPTRNIVGPAGSARKYLKDRGGVLPATPTRTVAPSQYLAYDPTYAQSAYPPSNVMAGNQTHNPAPGYMYFDMTGSVKESGYVLLPQDELILGVQWSPADAVHRSFKAISHNAKNLTFKNQLAVGLGEVPYFNNATAFETACSSSISAPEVGAHTYRNAGYCNTNDLTMYASASCTILQKPATLRLYGTLIKNNKQKQHVLPQQLVTNCIHEAIGDEPILDVYEISSTHLLSTSPAAKYVSGSLSSESIYFDVSTSKTLNHRYDLGRGERRSYANSNLFDVGSVKRVSKAFDMSEYYYDSLAPSIEEMFNIDEVPQVSCSGSLSMFPGGDILRSPDPAILKKYDATNGTFVPISRDFYPIAVDSHNRSEYIISGINNAPAPTNKVFGRSFPFEPRYSSVKRMFYQNPQAGYFFGWQEGSTKSTEKPFYPTMYSGSLNWLGLTGASHLSQVGFTSASLHMDPGIIPNNGYTYLDGQYGSTVSPAETKEWDKYKGLLLPPSIEKINRSRDMGPSTAVVSPNLPGSLFRKDFFQGDYTDPGGPDSVGHIVTNFELTSSNKTNLQAFFGVGDNRYGLLNHYYYYLEFIPVGKNHPLEVFNFIRHASLLTHKPRGYRYGLISSSPKKLDATYRRNNYGQFRDLLEQRKYSALFINDPIDVVIGRNNNNLQHRSNLVTTPAVTCTFREPIFKNPIITGQAAQVSPVQTNSSNLSNAATSSLPFYDGELKNRDTAPASDTETIVL